MESFALCLVLLFAFFSPSLSQGTQFCPIELTMDGSPCGENGKYDCVEVMIARYGASAMTNTCSCTTLPDMQRTCNCLIVCQNSKLLD
ncbi:hypothetical protein ES288_A07G132900v1 [Gossypium darwinii]|uniref:Uncharacterized protein n=1 Tax=Gossypium darwinii TaxID=34276 RepID=A0A5D2FYQ2_GOSDA|nr:hypothetical protein ES288_A07G132900v1 [Gossypium darwinii]